MKIKFDENMQKKILMYTTIAAIALLLYFLFTNFFTITRWISSLMGLMSPFILGFAIAFLLNKPMMFFERKLFGRWKCKPQMKRNMASILAMIVGIVVVVGFVSLLIPQLLESVFSLVKAFPGYVDDFQKFVIDFMRDNNIDQSIINRYITDSDLLTKLTEVVTKALPQMAKMTYQLGSTLLNILLGIVSGLYMMMDKERLSGFAKKINYALFPDRLARYFHRMVLASGDIFNNFIIGKAIDSLIIGIICYIGSLIFQFPYALLLSVFVGVTNMIPVFGPFIGAVPGIVILFIIHPILALYFALFIFVLQQFDGNILGPLILGDKLGLPSIGILFSVCIGGGLFGIVGMFIGVPCFAVIYMAVREWVNYRLKNKQINLEEVSEEMKLASEVLEQKSES